MALQRTKIRGLATLAARIFFFWGGVVLLKGLYDLVWGVPEANLYAPAAWAFVTREEWSRYGGFEVAYGAACLGLAETVRRYAQFLPETLER